MTKEINYLNNLAPKELLEQFEAMIRWEDNVYASGMEGKPSVHSKGSLAQEILERLNRLEDLKY